MTIADAARATRKYGYWKCAIGCGYFIASDDLVEFPGTYSRDNARAVCDRLNLLAVLEAIHEPSDAVRLAIVDAMHTCVVNPSITASIYVYRAMIDALTAEVRNDA